MALCKMSLTFIKSVLGCMFGPMQSACDGSHRTTVHPKTRSTRAVRALQIVSQVAVENPSTRAEGFFACVSISFLSSSSSKPFLRQVPPWNPKKKFNRNVGLDYQRPSQSKPRQWLRVCTMRPAVRVSAMQIHRWWAICFNMISPRRLISLKSGHWLYLSNESALLWKRAISPWGCKKPSF